MGTDHKEKLIRVLQILEETDEKSPMNATQILKYLEEEYQIEQVDAVLFIVILKCCNFVVMKYISVRIKRWAGI